MKITKTILSVSLAIMMASFAFGQAAAASSGSTGGPIDVTAFNTMGLARPDIQKELGLTKQQQDKIASLQQAMFTTRDEKQRKKTEKEIVSVLTPMQSKRMQEVQMQINGGNRLIFDKSLQKKLSITPVQVDTLKLNAEERGMRIIPAKEAMKVLNPKQAEALKKMLGKTFVESTTGMVMTMSPNGGKPKVTYQKAGG